ncbi:hypothetical protein TrVE_jg7480 [Triparma verrucosa]|uniref:DEAD/DEAH-box helicase domain-containing protein n=1 Tax=Triparma verrucosa TaxID=1606542 RepID=A0A9W7F6N0_9STRA|nr:hypothetical protein TrVE_jg7480 [Triparma verrucosa]
MFLSPVVTLVFTLVFSTASALNLPSNKLQTKFMRSLAAEDFKTLSELKKDGVILPQVNYDDDVPEWLAERLKALSFPCPTLIQSSFQSSPPSSYLCSPPGSGKTLAYLTKLLTALTPTLREREICRDPFTGEGGDLPPLACVVLPTTPLLSQVSLVVYQLLGGNLRKPKTEGLDTAYDDWVPGSELNYFKYSGPKHSKVKVALGDDKWWNSDILITTSEWFKENYQDMPETVKNVIYDECDDDLSVYDIVTGLSIDKTLVYSTPSFTPTYPLPWHNETVGLDSPPSFIVADSGPVDIVECNENNRLFKLIRYLRGKDTAQMVYFKTYADVKKALPVVREGLWGIHNVSSLIPFREGGFNPVLQVDAFNRGEVTCLLVAEEMARGMDFPFLGGVNIIGRVEREDQVRGRVNRLGSGNDNGSVTYFLCEGEGEGLDGNVMEVDEGIKGILKKVEEWGDEQWEDGGGDLEDVRRWLDDMMTGYDNDDDGSEDDKVE